MAMGLAFCILKEPIETKTLVGELMIVVGRVVILL
jgi:transporter family protein